VGDAGWAAQKRAGILQTLMPIAEKGTEAA
jgi:hypothetical protein